jgi:hypothetical protein
MAPTKARLDLKARFVRNAIPTEQDFKDLIDAPLNQSDDGIFRNSGEPLSIVAGSDAQKRVLRFYGSPPGGATAPDWLISLTPGQDPNDAATNRAGFGIADGAGATRLFLDAAGNLGLGTNDPQAKLHVAGGGARIEGDLTVAGTTALTGAITASGPVTLGKDDGSTNVVMRGPVQAAHSDVYFTKTNHNHTGIGNTSGFAAIENAANFNGLMILGRAQSPHPIKPGVNLRVVRLWDFLDVQGEMRVTGPFLEISGAGNERCYIGGDGAGNDVQVGSLSPGVQNLAAWNATTGKFMTFFCQNLVQASDLTLKSNVSPLTGALEKVCALRGVRFDWRDDGIEESQLEISSAQQIGLIAQEVEQVLPEVITDIRGSLGISYAALIPLLIEAVKELQNRITRLESSALPGQGRSQDDQN